MFIDRTKVYVKGGDGGSGAASFLRQKYMPYGGPDGGDGGSGGSVIFEVDSGLRTLLDFKYQQHIKGSRGQHGQGKKRHGKNSPDLVVKVPPGTMVYRDETSELIADLIEPGQRAVIARGGRGGRGNTRFANATRKAPKFAEKGEPGEELTIILELKLLADVGLVGFPNAGKSTFLSRISAAKPKIASYPFTTLTPNLGEVHISSGRNFVVADIPGIIEGAHQGTGLGLKFLRHVERTRLLLFILDTAGTENREPLEDFNALQRELRLYSEKLSEKPQVVVANKIDLPQGQENIEKIRKNLPQGLRFFAVSAVTGEGIQELLFFLADELDRLEKEERETVSEEKLQDKERKIYRRRDEPEELSVIFDGEAYRVKGERIEKLVHMTDFNYEEGVERLQYIFSKIGLEERLKKEGIKEGDLVRIGPMEFNFTEEGF
ncbi:GTPase ObgE [Candidatus Contubernalis alkaliaceticus]|uniref:GTPase ObgE n=1 Tax=Candidatus Contubernalis alkaliaceticus TaxID=338645 RepID=UPI001F4C2781|nr:GTPase ObgE [Candidatus Contubernalis alkalaceticus]UNC93328.1 GTPase ObgE [Candidatus Contubernalis alkalaceticus]